MINNKYLTLIIITAFLLISGTIKTVAQTTEFTYQGRLTDGGATANTNYDFQFSLFDAPSSGNQMGLTLNIGGIPVSGGVFTVRLDFGAQFTGTARYLEIAVRQTGSGAAFVTLNPRQAITSIPYAVRSLNAANADTSTNSEQLGGIAANQYVQTNDSRLSNDRNPLAGSTNYIQNGMSQQSSSNFNISGNGTANIFNATTQFNINGNRVLGLPGDNTFVGFGTGQNLTTGIANVFVGNNAGKLNTTGRNNSFVGNNAGSQNTIGADNTFFGQGTGAANTGGSENTFIGFIAGFQNTSNFNTFVGSNSGRDTTTGNGNSFFGAHAGVFNTTGIINSFFGTSTGASNKNGNQNSFFGSEAGANNESGSNNVFMGVNAGYLNFTGSSNVIIGAFAGSITQTSNNNTLIGYNTNVTNSGLTFATAIGANSTVNASNTIALGQSDGSDKVVIYGLGSAGSTQLCRNALNQIATCSSSLRYKTNIASFNFGLSLVSLLKPITFDWKADGTHDLGFGAEDVARVNELLVIRNPNGEVEGVKYDRISAVLVNAVNEQQSQLTAQQKLIEQQQSQIAVQAQQIEQEKQEVNLLKKLVCSQNPTAEICKEK